MRSILGYRLTRAARIGGPWLLLAVFMHIGNLRAAACRWSPEADAPACQLIAAARVVFLAESLGLTPDPRDARESLYQFRVDRVYKGLVPSAIEVLVNSGFGTSCQDQYSTGATYLIFELTSSEDPLIVFTSECPGSRAAESSKSDVDFLDAYVAGKTTTAVYGKVLQWVTEIGLPTDSESAPLAGAAVVLTNSEHRFSAVSGEDGSFRFNGIPAGAYELSARLDPYKPDPVSYQVRVGPGNSRQVFIQLKAHSSIKGHLLGPEGNPAPRMRMELLRRNSAGEWHSTYKHWTTTNDRGAFEFGDIESGEYLLGYEIWGDRPSNTSPYPTRYFPGAPERADAEILTLAPGKSIEDLQLTLAPRHHERRIKITVVGADGRPPGNNLLQISNQNGLIQNLEGGADGGIYVFTGYQEREYEFYAVSGLTI